MKDGSRYIYGRHPVLEELRARPRDVQRLFVATGGRIERLTDLIRTAEHQKIPVVHVQKSALEELVGDVPHQGVVAAVVAFTYTEFTTLLERASDAVAPALLVGLDQIQDPHNLGAIVRSAYALGAHGIFLPKDNACEVTPVVVKSAAGATSYLPISRVTNMRRALEELKEAQVWTVGAVAGEGQALTSVDFTLPTAIIVGSEGHGLRRLVQETCDVLAHIPMAGELGSLNASVAGSILLYEAARQRGA